MEAEEKITARWNYCAEGYDDIIQEELGSFRPQAWLALLEKELPGEAPLKILDVGTGPGFFTILLSSRGHKVTAIDSSREMLARAEQNVTAAGFQAEFYQMDAQEPSFEKNTFDVIISRNVTWTLLDGEKAYKNWKRILKKGGRLLIFDANWGKPGWNAEEAEDYRRREELFRERYGEPYDTFKGPDELRELNIHYPMYERQRPEWDVRMLEKLGYCTIHTDTDIIGQLWDEKEKLLYGGTPLFMIAGEKEREE
ncbi:MAG: class I SAM-dependent methyltransferase [Eubacteriales bacterium]|nr:class I SAM-dependent methyltransferase [Eubacteriales bacterium]